MRLKTLGGLAVLDAEGLADEVRIQRRQLAVLAVLAAEPSAAVSRERLVGLLWPDTEEGKARHALDQALYAVRRVLGAEVVVSGATSLQLDATVLPSDVAAFSSALKRGDLDAAVAAYTGPFLDGVHIPDAGEFAQWADGRRTSLADAFVQALTRLAKQASAEGDYALAAQHLRRAAASTPLDGAVARALVMALAYSGNPSAALEVARAHSTLVRQELGSGPDTALRDIIDKLRSTTPMIPPVPPRISAAIRVVPQVEEPRRTEPAAFNTAPEERSPSRAGRLGVLTLAVATVVLLGVLVARTEGTAGRHPVMLKGRQQVTTTGKISQPALSPDGTYLAYVSTNCEQGACAYGLEIQEVGSRVTRSVLEGTEGIDYIAWSADRRHLIVAGTLTHGHNGLYVVSALGGAPVAVPPPYFPAFFAGGDSLLLAPSAGPDTVLWMRVAGLDAIPRDSIRVPGPGMGIPLAINVPGTSWFIIQVLQGGDPEIRVVDRAGRESDRRVFPTMDLSHVSSDAVWFTSNFNLVRVPFDSATGRLATALDTVYVGLFTAFDVTSDGRRLLLDEGTEDYEVFGLTLNEALRGEFAPGRRLARASARVAITISPDSKRILLAREPGIGEKAEFRLWTIPFDGGAETPLATRGRPGGWTWVDSTRVVLNEFEAGRSHAVVVNVLTGARLAEFTPPDSAVRCCPIALPGEGWAWIPGDGQSVRVQRKGDAAPHSYPSPAWFQSIGWLTLSPDGQRLLFLGKHVMSDSIRVSVLSLADGSTVDWWTEAGTEGIEGLFLKDGSMLLVVYSTPDTRTLYRVRAPGIADTLGTIPRPVWGLDVSPDMKRAVVGTREYHGDAWMYRVER